MPSLLDAIGLGETLGCLETDELVVVLACLDTEGLAAELI